jgi:hypothetical protein
MAAARRLLARHRFHDERLGTAKNVHQRQHVPLRVAQECFAARSGSQAAHFIGRQVVQERLPIRAAYFDLRAIREVGHARRGRERHILGSCVAEVQWPSARFTGLKDRAGAREGVL